MAPGKPAAAEFNAIINADRQRRKNQELANEIFGSKNRRSSAPGAGAGANRKPAAPSLASRITGAGVTKRSASTTSRPLPKPARQNARPPAGNVNEEWTHDLHSAPTAPQNPRAARSARGNRGDRLYSALTASTSSPALNTQFNVISSPKPTAGISIRGLAGPYIVIAKNFAPGTTSADIESATMAVAGTAMSCRLLSERPIVVAELIYETRESADMVVDTFHGQNADGNLLEVYHKSSSLGTKLAPTGPASTTTPLGPRADAGRANGYGDRSGSYASKERSRHDYAARAEVVDGSYGFDDRMDTDEGDDNGRGQGKLYSDSLAPKRGGMGGSRERGRRYERGSRSYN